MAKYRKKPVVIDAMQYTKDNIHEVMSWIESFGKRSSDVATYRQDTNKYEIDTLEGKHEVTCGDFIIRGIKGEFYPCKPDIFEATYEKVGEDGEK